MTLGIAGKAIAVWLGILVLAVVNGMAREAILVPMLGNVPAFILSGILLSMLIVAVSYLSLPWIGQAPVASYIAIGFAWLSLTLAFEFIFGRLIQGHPWSQIFEAYTFKDGNIWPVVLLTTAAAPCVAARIRGWV